MIRSRSSDGNPIPSASYVNSATCQRIRIRKANKVSVPLSGVSNTQTDASTDAARQLVSQLKEVKRGTTPARNLPLRVAFPHFGPSIFLKSELTSESQTPVVELDFQRDRKRGER